MEKSNIVASSNVFYSWQERPEWDKNFVAQLVDYQKLKYIKERHVIDNRIPLLTKIQMAITRSEKRCVNAKNDPCWGYNEKKKRVTCACINEECQLLSKCNPHFSKEEAVYWKKNPEQIALYGDPRKLRKYYKVDMVSEEEMKRYVVNPGNSGVDHRIPPNPVPDDPSPYPPEKPKYKIDPETGRKMVIVGHKWVITDNASYENERLVPIWGFVEDDPETSVLEIRKARTIERKDSDDSSQKRKQGHIIEDVEEDPKQQPELKERIRQRISERISVIDLIDKFPLKVPVIIVTSNPAEAAYVSSLLLTYDIPHGKLDNDNLIQITAINKLSKSAKHTNVYVCSSIFNDSEEKETDNLKTLLLASQLNEFTLSGREYCKLSYGEGDYRWCCRNMYGITHICITEDDIKAINKLSDGQYFIDIRNNKIVDDTNEVIGEMNEEFCNMLKDMEIKGEIPGSPECIEGLAIRIRGNEKYILGMGHLEFLEY